MANEAYVEVNMGMQHAAKKKGPITKTYLAHRKKHFDELRVLHAELAAETAAAASCASGRPPLSGGWVLGGCGCLDGPCSSVRESWLVHASQHQSTHTLPCLVCIVF